jgi:hypothetical protein
MNKDELMQWALANGWQMAGDAPSLMKPPAFRDAIVRIVLKATMANIEIKKPAGKWEKVSGESYSKMILDPDTGIPSGLGLDTIVGLTSLMRDNKDRLAFAKKP